ncbi:hypothetical protein P755_gp123 [Mycobacterium phage Quink]|uniref:Uncharacterized protein n=21 Tax=Viruses TaxID=10239 RepID=Q857M8_9CAUD|nr:gp136 [Mycobacterium phage Cjw1]YP_008051612.1 hypothetical protein PBI_MURPHY_135 [Mycobacterium phage Murphy]YP_008052066.1 hypothetical protein PBI_PHRUX_132 [Mycobacterium phage Phrux]YP_008052310.1 hypothetical protein M039_gp118 [Mycobacterium phage Phaux]YP_008409530.1 hypothetical protein DRDREY_139 [Mycobacterium phage DrDrey]YP_008410148.1 hypothetical protein PBI_CONTAGION_132 [Mycobacterium phage Contagion]YP_008430649.1 hypothetical protein GOKU_135 [Mycobacterium phage Goku]
MAYYSRKVTDMSKNTRIRAGLYRVTTARGEFTVERRQAPGNGYGSGWYWYVDSVEETLWIDPFFTKAEALEFINGYGA